MLGSRIKTETTMELTRDQRNRIYRESLELLKSEEYYAICYCIENVMCRLDIFSRFCSPLYSEMVSWLPELRKRKPKTAEMFWWPVEDKESRIKVLKQCIRETQPKKRIKK